jgi:tetrahydromethanopterin S-methyltransferase subunit F
MPPYEDHTEILKLLRENNELAKENRDLLKKLHRNGIMGFWFTIVWYGLLIGLPFALYFYVVEPYFEAFGSSYDTFKTGLNELPGLKGIDQVLDSIKNSKN